MDAAQPRCNAPVRLGFLAVGAAQPISAQRNRAASELRLALATGRGGVRALAFMQDDFVLHGSCIEGGAGLTPMQDIRHESIKKQFPDRTGLDWTDWTGLDQTGAAR